MVFLLGVFGLVLGVMSILYLTPVFNRFFGLIWLDPVERQRRAVIRRLNEFYVDGHVSEEVAVLLASKEFNVSEQALLDAAGILSVSEVKGLLTGRMTLFGVIAKGIEHALKRNSKLTRRNY